MYIIDSVISAVCYINRYYTHEVKPILKEISLLPIYIDHDITSM